MTSKFDKLRAERDRIQVVRGEEIVAIDNQCSLHSGGTFLATASVTLAWDDDAQKAVKPVACIHFPDDGLTIDELDQVHKWAHDMLDDKEKP